MSKTGFEIFSIFYNISLEISQIQVIINRLRDNREPAVYDTFVLGQLQSVNQSINQS